MQILITIHSRGHLRILEAAWQQRWGTQKIAAKPGAIEIAVLLVAIGGRCFFLFDDTARPSTCRAYPRVLNPSASPTRKKTSGPSKQRSWRCESCIFRSSEFSELP